MTCPTCGCQPAPGAQFCKRCGAKITNSKSQPSTPLTGPNVFIPEQTLRVGHNLQALGVLWCMYGGYRVLQLLAAYFAWQTFGRSGFGEAPPFVYHWFTALAPVLGATALVWAALSVATGLALLARKSWARPLAIGLGIVSLLKVPIGTALGIYTLWVLAPSAAGQEWRRIQRA